ncbi:putative F-box protein [Helianthus annuus]|nr:putative F-box protein [Helianthus annuus]KAJ0443957.1 putative F-box domain-containing protein [Helianthus annuus]KAJ0461356.1 putative F-box protein [Helianthus annuus]KAJ0641782.1 putative F-box protein [Helianthus annuus]
MDAMSPLVTIVWSMSPTPTLLQRRCRAFPICRFAGTAKTMHMNRYQNGNASSSKSLKTSIISSLSSWSNLDHDLLLPILMKLGPVDFLAFSGVCKSWRSLAFANLNKFMGSRRPMSVSFSTSTNNECYLEDFEGRKFKTILPHSTGSTCVGLTCGYLIFFRSITCEFWLVNPLSKCELHFPNFPRSYKVDTNPSIFRGILVFSPSRSQWVLVISQKFTKTVLYSVSGKQATWRFLSLPFPILDIHSFNGKMYTISSSCHLYEVRLNAMPSLTLLGMKNFPERGLLRPEFVNSGKTLYVVSCIARDVYEAYEMDFEQMECMRIEKPTVENAFFVGDWKSSAAVNPDTWAKRQMRNERLGLKDSDQSKIKGRCLITNMWYFPHECFNANLLQ